MACTDIGVTDVVDDEDHDAADEDHAVARIMPPKLAVPPQAVQPATAAPRAPLLMQLARVEVHSIDEIAETHQQFKARIYIILRIPRAGLDEHLSKDSNVFPVDATGKPTFKPAARWFMEQLDFVNCEPERSRLLDSKAVRAGDDMELRLRFDGSFRQAMDLRSLPFDDHHLTVTLTEPRTGPRVRPAHGAPLTSLRVCLRQVTLCLYCRTDGQTPVKLEVAPDVVMDIRERGFVLSNLWELDRTIYAYTSLATSGKPEHSTRAQGLPVASLQGCCTVHHRPASQAAAHRARGACRFGGRSFPQIHVAVHVARKPWFAIRTAALPIFLLAFLAFVQYTFRYEHMNDRVTAMLTLVLTAAAVKLATQALLPQLSYTTMLDRCAPSPASLSSCMHHPAACTLHHPATCIHDPSACTCIPDPSACILAGTSSSASRSSSSP